MKSKKRLVTNRPDHLFVVTVAEAAEEIGKSRYTIYRRGEDGTVEIRSSGVGRTAEGYLTREDVEKLRKIYGPGLEKRRLEMASPASSPTGH